MNGALLLIMALPQSEPATSQSQSNKWCSIFSFTTFHYRLWCFMSNQLANSSMAAIYVYRFTTTIDHHKPTLIPPHNHRLARTTYFPPLLILSFAMFYQQNYHLKAPFKITKIAAGAGYPGGALHSKDLPRFHGAEHMASYATGGRADEDLVAAERHAPHPVVLGGF